MKRLVWLLWAALLMAPAAGHAGFDPTGQPLQCIGTDTFFPRGDRWVEPPGGLISLRFQQDGPTNQTGIYALTGPIANQAIYRAFGVWSGVTCANGLKPNLRFTLGANYPTRDTGYNPGNNTYQTVIYFAVTPGPQWPADSLTVANTTTNTYDVTHNIQSADMIFNGINFGFHTTDAQGNASGCNSANAGCYDLESVALHEVGHFIGFGHVACNNAVMFPSFDNTAQITTLSHHEQAGVCALYAPRTYAGTESTMGESCANANDCLKGLSCLKPPQSIATSSSGWCAASCSSTNDCPVGWICGPVGASANVCQPGVHLSGVPVADVQSELDLCAICTDGLQCDSGVCSSSDADGICTQTCSGPSFACPAGFTCSATQAGPNICYPNLASTCNDIYKGAPNNAICLYPAATSGASTTVSRPCASPGQCFYFPTGNISYCVQPCTAGSPGVTCASGFTCCFDLDGAGHCVTSQANRPVGGCFKLRQAGESCVSADMSVCEVGLQCLTNSASADTAQCYHTCTAGSNNGCGVGETCVSAGSTALCCDASRYDGSNIGSCWPVHAACTREVGVSCSNNADCQSNYCLKGTSGSSCSTQCSTSNDCPGAGVDVNDDGVGDAGTSCRNIGSTNACVPIGAIAAPPACASSGGSGNSDGGGGGGCSTVTVQDFAWTWAIVALAWAARRAKLARAV